MKKEDELKSLVKYAKPTILNALSLRQPVAGHQGELNQDQLTSNTEDILNSILPPREYTLDKKQLYIENVLSTPSTREDVIALSKELDKRLREREARENGLCPIREDLFSQCLDELIRQITISCSHRGLLLVRVKDELKMNLESYQVSLKETLPKLSQLWFKKNLNLLKRQKQPQQQY